MNFRVAEVFSGRKINDCFRGCIQRIFFCRVGSGWKYHTFQLWHIVTNTQYLVSSRCHPWPMFTLTLALLGSSRRLDAVAAPPPSCARRLGPTEKIFYAISFYSSSLCHRDPFEIYWSSEAWNIIHFNFIIWFEKKVFSISGSLI